MKKLLALLCAGALVFGSAAAAEDAPVKLGLMFGLTGTASPIGPVQLDGAKLAIDEVNAAGGIDFGDSKRKVEYIVRDDETKPDSAIRRFRDFVNVDGVDAVIGQSLASISGALNKEVKRTNVAYFPVNVVGLDLFTPQELSESTFAIHGCAYSAGYASAVTVVNRLGKKKIVFFGPAYAFGQDQWKGAQAAFKELGVTAEYLESPVGTNDFTSYLTKIIEMEPEAVMLAHWGVDAINVLKQAQETGLKNRTTIFFNWMTNAFGSGVPAEAIDGVYSLMSWYHNLAGFEDKEIVEKGAAFTKKFTEAFGYPPDPYSVMAYDGTLEALRALSLAGSSEPSAVSKAIMANPKFESVKGSGEWRIDHQPKFDYGAFIVVGKGPSDRKDKWDLVKVVGAYTGDDFLPSLELFGY